MARSVTLFTGQWADLPLEEVAKLASDWGYDGLELACWGDHLDPWRWDDDDYVQGKLDLLAKYNLKCWAISNHLKGQAVCDDDRSAVTATSCRTRCGATATRRACVSERQRR